ncbi:hypothetical protein NC653_004868 [Populus alba x Populus x berolinensis]|uniref:Uncharacterized protein n=1 Tax=Populus alba x Populus x berolinensis TaxID=444605 RepID=A0AAD6RVQ9_9ROSI|nr:hypothetical protein NC653_004868 [Populus alba x Populus x berolinensis]
MPMPMFAQKAQKPSSFPEPGIEGEGLAMGLAIVVPWNELVKMCHANEPLLESQTMRMERKCLILKSMRECLPWGDSFQSRTRTQNKWMEPVFPTIVATSKNCSSYKKTGVCGASGSLHLNLQVLSPFGANSSKTHFLQLFLHNKMLEEGTWAIVDFPLDSFHDNNSDLPFPCTGTSVSRLCNSRTCPMVDMDRNHAEIEDKPVHQIFNQYVYSGMAFGALLQRQCERVASLMARNISDPRINTTLLKHGENMMRLAQRMIRTFKPGISSTSKVANHGQALPDSHDGHWKSTEPGQPNGVVLSASIHNLAALVLTSYWKFFPNGNALHEGCSLLPTALIQETAFFYFFASTSPCNSSLACRSHCGVVYKRVYALIKSGQPCRVSPPLAMSGEDPSCIPATSTRFGHSPSRTQQVALSSEGNVQYQS